MTVHHVNSTSGSESNGGTSQEDAWLYPPGMTGSTHAGDVDPGDEVAIGNGSSYSGRRLVPLEGVSYYGYGLGGAQITIKKVVPGIPALAYDYEVARERGVHQGSWALSAGSLGANAVLRYNNDGASVADVVIDGGPAGDGFDAVLMGNDYTVASATLRRACVLNSSDIAIRVHALVSTLEEVQVLYSENDCFKPEAVVTNDYAAGGSCTLTDCDFRNPNTDRNGDHVAHDPGVGGDCIQLQHSAGQWKRSCLIDGLYLEKHDGLKQAIIFSDAYGGVTIRNVHIHSSAGAVAVIGMNSIRGAVLLEDIYANGGCGELCFYRMMVASGSTLPDILASTGSITIRRTILDGTEGGMEGLFQCATPDSDAGNLDGSITIESCVVVGAATADSEGLATLWKTAMTPTVGTLRATIRNNASFMTGSRVHVILPTGKANNANYRVENNYFPSSSSLEIGATTYASVALFQAAHSYATGNDDAHTLAEMLFNDDFSVDNASPLLAAGIWHRHKPVPRQLFA